MKFLCMHRHDPKTEAGEPPPLELVAQMGELIGEYAARGQFLDGAGLGKSGTRTRLVFKDGGEPSVEKMTPRGHHELPSAFLKLTVERLEQGLDWARRYGKILGDAELELSPVNEPWDLGLMPRPENPPLHLLLIEKGEPTPRTPKQKGDLTRLKQEMTAAGVLEGEMPLAPSARAKRLFFRNHALSVLDGPFAESKELVGGFALMDLPSMDAAIEMAKRYAGILGGTLEMDLRPLADATEI
jgi:hypothetical protein